MKLTVLLLTVSILTVRASSGLGQSVTLSGRNLTVVQVFAAIKQQTGYLIPYNRSMLNNAVPVSVEARNMPLKVFLETVLKDQPFGFELSGKTIILFPVRASFPADTSQVLPVFMPVNGQVSDVQGIPLAGINIMIKGTHTGTITDSDGRFALNAQPNQVLVISSVGWLTKELKVSATFLSIHLEKEVAQLEETVIKGYYTTSKKLNTGSVSSVNAEAIEKQPVVNVLSALQGRMAGVNIVQSTGIAGGNFKVEIRGQNSLRDAGNNPLYIINGVPYFSKTLTSYAGQSGLYPAANGGENPLNNLNPSEIESIEVLKDADATAIYGSRGANGVVLITTKKGDANGMQTSADVYAGVSRVATRMEMLNTKQYLEMRKEGYANDGVSPYPPDAYDLNVWDQERDIDWQKELIGGTASTLNGQLAFAGGSSDLHYRFGGGYNRETSVFPGEFSNQRGSGHFSLSATSPNKKTRALVTMNYGTTINALPRTDLTEAALFTAPNVPALLDDAGNLNFADGTVNSNPLSYTKQTFDSRSNSFTGNTVLSYQPAPALTIKVSLGFTNTRLQETNKTPVSSVSPAYAMYYQNETVFGNTSTKAWIAEPQVNWKKQFGPGVIDVLTGATFQHESMESLVQYAQGFSSEALMDNIAAAPPSQVNNIFAFTQYRYNALFGRVGYNINDTWLLNLTGRRDGSSRFGPGKQFGNFGAASIGWIFSNARVIKEQLRFLSYGKIRSSYGLTGSDQIGDYQYMETFGPSGQYLGVSGLAAERVLNPDFSWETNRKFEVAMELGLFQDKILFTGAWYRNRSSNQLVGNPLPPSTGFYSVQSNLPATVQNTGLELSLNITKVKFGPLSWSSGVNISFPRNKLISYPGLEKTFYETVYSVGEPLNIYKVLRYQGVNASTGLYEFLDTDGNGEYDQTDKIINKFLGARYFGGFQNTFRYKSFQLDIMLQFTNQQGRNYRNFFYLPSILVNNNQPIEIMDRWRKPGDQTAIQVFSGSDEAGKAYTNFRESDAAVTDASFIRLKNVSLSYQIISKESAVKRVTNLLWFIQAQNLYTFTSYKGLDPESQGSTLPPLRTLATGFKLAF